MDISQLKRSVEDLQFDINNLLRYSPFLGVVNYDFSDDKVKTALKLCCKKIDYDCCGDLFFMVLNSSFAKDPGEHWLLLAFRLSRPRHFLSFNTYGVAHTLNVFGWPKTTVLDSKRRRVDVLQELVHNIWNDDDGEIFVEGFDGIHQDFSTDECGYHVYRFSSYLIDAIAYNNYDGSQWGVELLKNYIYDYDITMFHYSDKKLKREHAQPHLLENDRQVRLYVESKIPVEDRIEEHDEYSLTDPEWCDQLRVHVQTYEILKPKFRRQPGGISTIVGPLTIITMPKTVKKKKKQQQRRLTSAMRSEKPFPTDPRTGINYDLSLLPSSDDTFERFYAESQTSYAREMILKMFPQHIAGRHDPLINKIAPSEMLSKPNYLDEMMMSLPGDNYNSIMTVGEYFYNDLGIRQGQLNPKDPFTYQLAKLTQDKFENHQDKRTVEQIRKNMLIANNKAWKTVKQI